MSLSHATLLSLLDFCPHSGVFSWRVKASSTAMPGYAAGHVNKNSYCRVKVQGKLYLAHRLAWFYAYKVWPVGHIDHIDGDKSNNRLSNLRVVTIRGNQQNQSRAHKRNKSGLLGVATHRSGFTSRISNNGKVVYLGLFKTPEEAHQAYLEAKRKYHPTCTI